jgi:copper chaperone CopZ
MTKSSGTYTGTGVLSAIAASLCCITPVIALIAGSSSITAATTSWIEPARPYLIGLSITSLTLAWYIKLRPLKPNNADCNCESTKKVSFFQTKIFLSIVTGFAILTMSFPLYARVFYQNPKTQTATAVTASHKQQINFAIQGMTCESCEEHVNTQLSNVAGILSYKTSYALKNCLVTFDASSVDIKTIETAINKTGYKVKSHELISEKK